MKTYALRFILVTAVVLFVAAPASADGLHFEASSNPAFNLLLLPTGHSQTMFFELGNSIFNDTGEFHTLYLMTLGAGTVTIRVGAASSVGEYAGLIYAVAGFVGLQPVAQFAYNAETISYTVEVPEFAVGILFTTVLMGIGSPDYPVVMSMVVSHL